LLPSLRVGQALGRFITLISQTRHPVLNYGERTMKHLQN